MQWVVDGNNVMASRPDGWWRDRSGAATRLAGRVRRWCERESAEPVVLVFDGSPVPAVGQLAGGPLRIEFAPGPGPDAADDRIVELVPDLYVDPELTVVTADRGLIDRLPPGVAVMGPGRFLALLDAGGY